MKPLDRLYSSGRAFMLTYFLLIIGLGSSLLSLPQAWSGPGGIRYIDALFTATSAACVTGLITVNTADFTRFGQTIIMSVIQAGGLGIIAFSTIYLIIPATRISLRSSSIIQEYYVDQVDFDPRRIVRNILVFTLVIQALGVASLVAPFAEASVEAPFFTALFHSISAFCNAGFSTFPNSLEDFVLNHRVTVPVMLLIVVGGIGFVVIQDLSNKIKPSARRLALHTRAVLLATATLIVVGTAVFWTVERGGVLFGMTGPQSLLAALFQSITPRTAGFNTVPQDALTPVAQLFTMALMFTGGAPGSVAGGIKVTTALIILTAAVMGTDENGDIHFWRRRIPARMVAKAHGLLVKALLIVVTSSLLLTLTEHRLIREGTPVLVLLFETISAFGTVGLSLGVTGELSDAGRLVMVLTMFAGRVGLISLAIPRRRVRGERLIGYPTGEFMIG